MEQMKILAYILGPFTFMAALATLYMVCLIRAGLDASQSSEDGSHGNQPEYEVGKRLDVDGVEEIWKMPVRIDHAVIIQPNGSPKLGRILWEEYAVRSAVECNVDQVRIDVCIK